MTKTIIFSGFLGAGKTTLIKKLVKEVFANEKVVIIENEFGEIGIDSGFLKEAGIQVTEMNSGCICCSLVGDFSKSLKEVINQYQPERIIVEPSGVGKLSDVLKAVENVANQDDVDIKIDGLVAVVDAKKAKMYAKNFGEFFSDQIATAKTVVLSRSQDVNEKQLDVAVDIIKDLNDDAVIVTTPWDEIPGSVIFNAIEHGNEFVKETEHEHHHEHEHEHEHDHHHEHDEHCECGCHDHDHEHHHDHDHEHEHEHEHEHDHHHEHDEHCECGCHDHDHDHEHHHHHHADDVFTSVGYETAKKYSKDEIENVLKTFANEEAFETILRAKGILPGTDGEWIHFDYVPGEYQVRTGEADFTGKICVIGTKVDEARIKEMFKL